MPNKQHKPNSVVSELFTLSEEYGMSDAEIASEIGIHRDSLARWWAGCNVRPINRAKIARLVESKKMQQRTIDGMKRLHAPTQDMVLIATCCALKDELLEIIPNFFE